MMRRDRAGCWISMDGVSIFSNSEVEIWCEKERWAVGKISRSFTDAAERNGTRGLNTQKPTWSLSVTQTQSTFVPEQWRSENGGLENAASASVHPNPPFALSLELCLVGTSGGAHVVMTEECSLQAWKVLSHRSFVSFEPSMCVISEESQGDPSWPRDPDGGAVARRTEDDDNEFGTPRSQNSLDAESSENLQLPSDPKNTHEHEHEHVAPWRVKTGLVPWCGEKPARLGAVFAFDKAEVLNNARARYEDVMREWDDNPSRGKSSLRDVANAAFSDQESHELTWFSAGIRAGVGMGLGVCLGLGLGVGILVNGYRAGKDRLGDVRQALRLR